MQAGNQWKIDACVNELLKVYRYKKSIPYDDVLRMAARHALYKDDLPDIQQEIEDIGKFIDYD